MATANSTPSSHNSLIQFHYTDGHAYDVASKKFKELVEERAEGRYTITIFSNSALGTQEEVTEAAQMGTIDLVVTSDDKLEELSIYCFSWLTYFGALTPLCC